jgi:Fungal protein kinase
VQEPLKFIQVIASFSLLSPEMLGFDPTIELLVSPNRAVPSYKPNEEFIRAYQAAPHNRQWVIKMNDESKYVTIETVSSVRAGFMRGRGSIVWVVVPFDEANEKREVRRSFE